MATNLAGITHEIEHKGVTFTVTCTGADRRGRPAFSVVGREVDPMARMKDYIFTMNGAEIDPRDTKAVTEQLSISWGMVLDGVGRSVRA